MSQKNFFGQDPHPSDDLLNWRSVFKGTGFPAEKIAALRAAYDSLNEWDPAALRLIINAAREYERLEQADREAGEGI